MPTPTRGSDDRTYERHTGADGIIKFNPDEGENAGTYLEIPITSVDWNRTYTTEDVQHNGTQSPTLTTTEIRYDGSFEYEGQNPDLMDAITLRDEDLDHRRNRPIRGTLTIKEYEHDDGDETVATITFKRVLITDINRDYPADGVTSASIDWEAEDMIVTT